MASELTLGIHLCSLQRERWDLEQCLAWASGLEIHAFEAGPEFPGEHASASRVRKLLDVYGLAFTALDINTEPRGGRVSPPGADLEPPFQWAREAGCRQIVLTGLELDDADRVYPRIAAMAERWGIGVSVDLWGALVCRAEELRRVLDETASPWIRAGIDTGHVLGAGGDPLELAAAFEGRIGHFRIRTGSREYGVPPLRSILELLLDGGYEGGLSILDESGSAQALAGRVEEAGRMLELAISNSK